MWLSDFFECAGVEALFAVLGVLQDTWQQPIDEISEINLNEEYDQALLRRRMHLVEAIGESLRCITALMNNQFVS